MLETAPTPTNERKPAWRAARLAYREARRTGSSHQVKAATRALQAVWPLPWKEPDAEAINAVSFASSYHTKWFWSGKNKNRSRSGSGS